MPQSTNPRLVITGHAADGKSIFHTDEAVETFYPFGPSMSSFSTFDTRQAVPVANHNNIPEESASAPMTAAAVQKLPRCPPDGVLFCVSNIPPLFSVPLHRTQSLDYCIVVSGEIVLALDEGGEEKTVRAGEFVIQGGANHRWINRTDEPCRIAFVMVGAEKVTLANGTALAETAFKGSNIPERAG
ncbi:hypothetical protein PG999_008842 [Apiospora kogelbergensis]|uniref:Cupin type-2 domain-containing protein n=1 Tax=Apiospora kogelbergensis TaxID=1337665 RepID=A0AAW0QJM7_9PEZI